MRYIFISDVHGEYNKMIKALKAVAFDKEKDTLITLGDLFDHGEQSLAVLTYVMSLPHKICVWGNHDSRLKALMCGANLHRNDKKNGVENTFISLMNNTEQMSMWNRLLLFTTDARYEENKNLLFKYFDSCVNAVEFPTLIGTHGWLPYIADYDMFGDVETASLDQNWRYANKDAWEEAFWAHTENMIKNKCFPKKDMIIGHWHTWRIATKIGKQRVSVCDEENGILLLNCATYQLRCGENPSINLICIDGCSNYEYGGCVNAYVYESDVEPITY